jgi:hypothetical protein
MEEVMMRYLSRREFLAAALAGNGLAAYAQGRGPLRRDLANLNQRRAPMAAAHGAKLACPGQFLDAPPKSSAQGFLTEVMQKDLPEKRTGLKHFANLVFFGLHMWRNAGLVAGLPMPGLDDVLPKPWERSAHAHGPDLYSSPERLQEVMEGLRPRAAAIDNAFAGQRPPSIADYVKEIITAREKLAPFIDYGSSVELVRTPFPREVGWRFTSEKGMALTAVSVANAPREVTFSNTRGTWKDHVNGETFTARDDTLAVTVPPHRVRLLTIELGERRGR